MQKRKCSALLKIGLFVIFKCQTQMFLSFFVLFFNYKIWRYGVCYFDNTPGLLGQLGGETSLYFSNIQSTVWPKKLILNPYSKYFVCQNVYEILWSLYSLNKFNARQNAWDILILDSKLFFSSKSFPGSIWRFVYSSNKFNQRQNPREILISDLKLLFLVRIFTRLCGALGEVTKFGGGSKLFGAKSI